MKIIRDYIKNTTVVTETWKFHSANILEFHRNSAVTMRHRLYRTPVSLVHMGEEKISRAVDTLTDLPCLASNGKNKMLAKWRRVLQKAVTLLPTYSHQRK